MSQALTHDLQQLLARVHPQSLLCVGASAERIARDYLSAHPQVHCLRLEPSAVRDPAAASAMHDLALVVGVVEGLAKQAGLELLARLRDLLARQVVLAVRVSPKQPADQSQWDSEDLIAMGMYRAGTYRDGGEVLHVYCFDLYDYKPTPDWLNSRHWAHPERFDKYWW